MPGRSGSPQCALLRPRLPPVPTAMHRTQALRTPTRTAGPRPAPQETGARLRRQRSPADHDGGRAADRAQGCALSGGVSERAGRDATGRRIGNDRRAEQLGAVDSRLLHLRPSPRGRALPHLPGGLRAAGQRRHPLLLGFPRRPQPDLARCRVGRRPVGGPSRSPTVRSCPDRVARHRAALGPSPGHRRFTASGRRSRTTFRSRVGTDVLQGSLSWSTCSAQVTLRAGGSVRRLDYTDFTCCGDPSLKQRVEGASFRPHPDTRSTTPPRARPLDGARHPRPDSPHRAAGEWRIGGAPTVDLQEGRRSWLRYAAGVEGNWDVTGNGPGVQPRSRHRASSIRSGVEPVPFTELVVLGGSEPFAGFIQGRLLDRSAIVAQLGWHWPVVLLPGRGRSPCRSATSSVPHLEDFSFDLLRLSAEIGLRSRGSGPTGSSSSSGWGPSRSGGLHRLLVPVVIRVDLWPVGTWFARCWPRLLRHRAAPFRDRPCCGTTTTDAPSRRSPSTTPRRWRGPGRTRRSSGPVSNTLQLKQGGESINVERSGRGT